MYAFHFQVVILVAFVKLDFWFPKDPYRRQCEMSEESSQSKAECSPTEVCCKVTRKRPDVQEVHGGNGHSN